MALAKNELQLFKQITRLLHLGLDADEIAKEAALKSAVTLLRSAGAEEKWFGDAIGEPGITLTTFPRCKVSQYEIRKALEDAELSIFTVRLMRNAAVEPGQYKYVDPTQQWCAFLKEFMEKLGDPAGVVDRHVINKTVTHVASQSSISTTPDYAWVSLTPEFFIKLLQSLVNCSLELTTMQILATIGFDDRGRYVPTRPAKRKKPKPKSTRQTIIRRRKDTDVG